MCRHYLTGALGASVHRPLVLVVVHHAVVDAHASVDLHLVLDELAVLRLRERQRREREREREKEGEI